MSVLFDLAYNEFEVLIRNHFSDEDLRLDNNQIRLIFEEIQDGNHGDTITNIYEIVKSVQNEVCTPDDLLDELLDTDLDVAVEWLIETDNYDKDAYISQDDFDNLDEDEQNQNELVILEDASAKTIYSIIYNADLEIDFISSVMSWKDISDFGSDYRYIR